MAKKQGFSLEKCNQLLKEQGIPYNQNLNKCPMGTQQTIQYLEKKFGAICPSIVSKQRIETSLRN